MGSIFYIFDLAKVQSNKSYIRLCRMRLLS